MVRVVIRLPFLTLLTLRPRRLRAEGAESAAAALSDMADNGARREQVRGVSGVANRPRPASILPRNRINRVQRLFDEGVNECAEA